jgi:hypothetical protein
MKGFISFLIAAVLYIVIGLIAWNVVCSFTDIPSKTIIELANYRLMTYSGITFVILILPSIFEGKDPFDEAGFYLFMIPFVINFIVAYAINYWEGMWESVSLIFTIIYNLINVLYIAIGIRPLLGK